MKWQHWIYKTWLVVVLSLVGHLSVAAAPCQSQPSRPQSNQCTISMPMEAGIVMEQTEINTPSAPVSTIGRSRRTISQLTNPTPMTYAQYMYHTVTKYLLAILYREKWIIINLPSEHISYPFHSFW